MSSSLKFGSFHTEKTHVGETWKWTIGVFQAEAGVKGEPYRFVFVEETGRQWQVDCRAKTPIAGWRTSHSETSVAIGETRLGCAMRGPADAVHSLALHGTGVDFRGETRFGDSVLAIRALHDIPDRNGRPFSIPGSLGYELRQGERVVASVDLLGKGRVYLARDLPAELRAQAAMTATVLMFFHES